VETNLDVVLDRLTAQSAELAALKEDWQRVQRELHKQKQDAEDEQLQLINIYPSPSDDGRLSMYPLSHSDGGDGLNQSTDGAEILYTQLEERLREKERDVASLNALLDSLNMSFQQKTKALDSCSAQLACFRQVREWTIVDML
jgi:chromosome segregation ATPase